MFEALVFDKWYQIYFSTKANESIQKQKKKNSLNHLNPIVFCDIFHLSSRKIIFLTSLNLIQKNYEDPV